MAFEEEMLAHALARVAVVHGHQITETSGVSLPVPRTPFPRSPLAEATVLLRKRG
ncbi:MULTISPECIES: hypothetical protein [Actinomadura]|uniref:Uncharacterized protein n=2 Tax=Actinomadura yumaensis TaxID=111807 RepID=A0ABW2CKL5_9ACTN|nr:hypothetical protein [Actinomadura sp. J1-007]